MRPERNLEASDAAPGPDARAPQLFVLGGYPNAAMAEHMLSLARGRRVLFDNTASPQNDESPDLDAEITPLRFYPWPPPDLREVALAHDVIYVGGGNTANLLAVWRTHGFDTILREAWQSGVLLCGWSAGMICWFEAGITDSFGPQLAGLRDGLGFLAGSACPHFDGEELRRPVYTRLVADGFPAGIALDDAAGAQYVGTELCEVVASTASAGGYRVDADGEHPLAVRRL